MRKFTGTFILLIFLDGCSQNPNSSNQPKGHVEFKANDPLAALFNNYYEQRIHLSPPEATANGNNRFKVLLTVDFTDNYLQKLQGHS